MDSVFGGADILVCRVSTYGSRRFARRSTDARGRQECLPHRIIISITIYLITLGAGARPLTLTDIGEAAPNTIEIRGVGADDFNPSIWTFGTVHLVPDARHPLLAPREGKWRNIYAPSIVPTQDGWRIFYGGWDGVDTGNDRIYTATTRDFLSFDDRHTVIEHGKFQHVCNVSAIASNDGAFDLMCTAYPTSNGTNKPAFFHLSDLTKTYVATDADLIKMSGYDKFPAADINGMNVILRDEDQVRLYFASFTDFGKVYRASSRDGRSFSFDGVALDHGTAPNDVKKFHFDDQNRYLMGLHMNGPDVFYALSKNGATFDRSRKLFSHRDESDRYIVAVGFVTKENKLLGVLYGAGAKSSLDQNRIFARWLQKRVVVTKDNESKAEAFEALGPDRALWRTSRTLSGTLELFNEDGTTLLATSPATLQPGRVYQLSRPMTKKE